MTEIDDRNIMGRTSVTTCVMAAKATAKIPKIPRSPFTDVVLTLLTARWGSAGAARLLGLFGIICVFSTEGLICVCFRKPKSADV